MSTRHRKILITGLPGTGKTTLIRKLCDNLSHLNPCGFYTAEIREGGTRKGFELIDLNGGGIVLSHINIKSKFRVGKYGVDIHGLDKYLDDKDLISPETVFLVIDEIGKMECLSKKFVDFILAALDSDRNIIATIALKGSGVIDKIKRRPDVVIYEISAKNRDAVYAEIIGAYLRS